MALQAVELREARVGTISAGDAARLGLPPVEREAVWGIDPDGQRVTFIGDPSATDMLRAAVGGGTGSVPVHLIRFPIRRAGWPGDRQDPSPPSPGR
jgi:hypothetical protein